MDLCISDYDFDISSTQQDIEAFRKDIEVYSKAIRQCKRELLEAETDQEKREIMKTMADCRWAIADAFERETVLLNEARNGGQTLEAFEL